MNDQIIINDEMFPPELDIAWYRSENNLDGLSDDEVTAHFYGRGEQDGLPGSEMCDYRNFCNFIKENFSSILQIMPAIQSLKGSNIYYADRGGLEELKKKFPQPRYRECLPPKIDFVVPDFNLSGLNRKFPCVFSSHNIQFAIDLIEYFNQIESILEPGGIFACIVPDKDYTLDYGREVSSLEDVLACHYDGGDRDKPHLLPFLQMRTRMRHNSAERHWRGDHGENGKPDYMGNLNAWLGSTGYADNRNWIFNASSFRELVTKLYDLGLINLRLHRIYGPKKPDNSFYAVFKYDRQGSCQPKEKIIKSLPPALNNVLVGKDGYLFLFRGTNNLLDQYFAPESEVVPKGTQIAELFRKREGFCARRNIIFAQLLIPEKSSILANKVSPYFPDITPLYQFVARMLIYENWFIDANQLLKEVDSFQKQDTHITTQAAGIITKKILDVVGQPCNYELFNSRPMNRGGDLLTMLTGSSKYGFPVELASELKVNGEIMKPELIQKIDPPVGHIGKQRKFVNSQAPIQKKVLCFGNSFFETGGASFNLTWFMARLFAEFHFYWSPCLLVDVIENERPDIVVCQTIERYLPAVLPRCVEELEGKVHV